MKLSQKSLVVLFMLFAITTAILSFSKFSQTSQIKKIQQSFSFSSTYQASFLKRIDSLSKETTINLQLTQIVQLSDSLTKEEFESSLTALYGIALSRLKNDTTLEQLIEAVEKATFSNQWKLILFPHFHTIALKSQQVSHWNNCIRLCPSDEEKKELVHNRRKIFLDYDSFAKSKINSEELLLTNPCYAPLITNLDRIHNKHYALSDLYNSQYKEGNYLRNRFILADFNSTNSLNECKGCVEEYANNELLSNFNLIIEELKKCSIDYQRLDELKKWYGHLASVSRLKWQKDYYSLVNYLQHVEQYRTAPMKKDPIIYVSGKPYCIGQRLCLCEIQNDTIIKVAQFVTSSKNAAASQANQHDFDGQPRYYAPQNKITSRFWDKSVKYDTLDKIHDQAMGKGSSGVLKYKGAVDLPNFMHITPVNEFPGAKGYVNGIHEFAVGGSRPALFMGTPISLGCVRLHDYPSKFTRWWTPYQANMFIMYDNNHYIQRPIKGIPQAKNKSKIIPDKENPSITLKNPSSSKKQATAKGHSTVEHKNNSDKKSN